MPNVHVYYDSTLGEEQPIHLKSNLKPASNDFGCICKQIWEDQCCMKACTTINMTKWHCLKMCVKLIITTKTFLPSSCLLSERLSLVTCKQGADHFTRMMWFDFIKWRFHFIRGRFHYSESIKYCQNIWYKTAFHLNLITDTCTQHER